jgi:flagellar FliL protein
VAKETIPLKKGPDKPQGKDESGMGFVIALAVLTLIAGGGGFLFASQVLKSPAGQHVPEKPVADKHEGGGHSKEDAEQKLPTGERIALPTIFTNLADPVDSYLRLEGFIVVEPGYSDGKLLAAKVSEDMIALLKTVGLSQLQGASGLSHLREDINDRVKIRSEGKASELIINTLVIE